MSANKITSPLLVSLIELKKRCPKSALKKFQQFVKKREKYITRLQKLEESGARGQLPQIDWDFYKRNVRSEAVSLVEEFERKYTSLTVPYPEDKYTPRLEKIKEKVKDDLVEFVNESNCRIESYQREIERIKNLLPFNQMTWEDYIDSYPDAAPDFFKKPTFWPHDPTEQIGYVDEEQIANDTLQSLETTNKSRTEFQGKEAKSSDKK